MNEKELLEEILSQLKKQNERFDAWEQRNLNLQSPKIQFLVPLLAVVFMLLLYFAITKLFAHQGSNRTFSQEIIRKN